MNSSLFLAITNSGLARVERQADSRWSVERLLDDQALRCLTADPLNRDIIYTAVDGQGVLRSNNRGQSWQVVGNPGYDARSFFGRQPPSFARLRKRFALRWHQAIWRLCLP
jgi:hypothetical protein